MSAQVIAEWNGRLFAATLDAYGTAVVTGLPMEIGAGDTSDSSPAPVGKLTGQQPE
jgi:hypothetical protein